MQSILKDFNAKSYRLTAEEVEALKNKCNAEIRKAVKKLSDMDYQRIDSVEFDMDEFLRQILEYHPSCEDSLFSSRTGRLLINDVVIRYAVDKAKESKDDDIKDLKEALKCVYTIIENQNLINGLDSINTLALPINPKLYFDDTTSLIACKSKLDFTSELVQKSLVIKKQKVKEYSFNEIYLKVLSEKMGISTEQFKANKKNNKGVVSDMSFEDEVKYISLILTEHIYIDGVYECAFNLYNSSVLKPMLVNEVIKEAKSRVKTYIDKHLEKVENSEIVGINTFGMKVVA